MQIKCWVLMTVTRAHHPSLSLGCPSLAQNNMSRSLDCGHCCHTVASSSPLQKVASKASNLVEKISTHLAIPGTALSSPWSQARVSTRRPSTGGAPHC